MTVPRKLVIFAIVGSVLAFSCGCARHEPAPPRPTLSVDGIAGLVERLNAHAALVDSVKGPGTINFTYRNSEGKTVGTEAEFFLAAAKPYRLRLKVEKAFKTRLDLLCDGRRFHIYEGFEKGSENITTGTLERLAAGAYNDFQLFVSPRDFFACLGVAQIAPAQPGRALSWEVYPHTYRLNVLDVSNDAPRMVRSFFIDRFHLRPARYQSFAPDGRVELDALLYYAADTPADATPVIPELVKIKRPFDEMVLEFDLPKLRMNEQLPRALFDRLSGKFPYKAPERDLDATSPPGQ